MTAFSSSPKIASPSAGLPSRSMLRGTLYFVLLVAVIGAAGCRSTGPYISPNAIQFEDARAGDSSELSHEILLLGDGGAATSDSEALGLLRKLVKQSLAQMSVVFLGDNVYCCGLPGPDHPDRKLAEQILGWQVAAAQGLNGDAYFLPGNHDWNGGAEGVERQEDYVESIGGDHVKFVPNRAKPGPKSVVLTDDLVLIFIDSEQYLRAAAGARKSASSPSAAEDIRADFLFELEQELIKHRKKTIVVLGHHPLYDNGKHGGHYSLRDQLKYPVWGSITAFQRRFFGGVQDISSREYTEFRDALLGLFTGRERLIYAAGHSHSLQYRSLTTRRRTWHHLVSGSVSKENHVVRGRGAEFASSETGLIRLRIYKDQSIVMDILQANGEVMFSKQLEPPNEDLRMLVEGLEPAEAEDGAGAQGGADASAQGEAASGETLRTLAANPSYRSNSRFKRIISGQHNRATWSEPVTLPVLDVRSLHGGLTPLQMGGGSQTVTIRFLSAEDNHVYMLRSVDKVAARIWPTDLQGTFAKDLLQDQTSMLHPYGALLTVPLARATGVYHTRPAFFVVPDDPMLGPFRGPLVGRIGMLEVRPNGDVTADDHFGNAEDVDGFDTVLEKIQEDNDHRVDQWRWARSRLLDMLIADTDRTADNWRFSVVEPADSAGKIYEALPRDRDAAFMRLNGILPSLYKIFVQDLWQEFADDYGSLRGLNRKGMAWDRRFTSELTRADWISIADSMQTQLSDSVLAHVLDAVPPEIAAVEGEAFVSTLTCRRDQLVEVAAKYYDLIARIVDVVGSDKHERFEVERMQYSTRVRVFSTRKDGETRRMIYERIIEHPETQEIRLYGLDGNDRFVLSGESREPVLVRIIGGPGEDHLKDDSVVRGSGVVTIYHDSETGNEIQAGPSTQTVLSATPQNNSYDPTEVAFGSKRPVTFFGSNSDDGFFLGGGIVITRDGFRKSPFGQRHRLQANQAFKTLAYNLVYSGIFTDFIRKWDLKTNLRVETPNNIRNFFGLSNESKSDAGRRKFYQAQFAQVKLNGLLEKELRDGLKVTFGPNASYTDVRRESQRFLALQPGIASNTFLDQWFAGLQAGVTIDTRDNNLNPTQGMRWTNQAALNVGVRNSSKTYTKLRSDLRVYTALPNVSSVTVALRSGLEHVIGDFPFYDASTLGGRNNLRGYRSTRFAGRTAAWFNTDVRFDLFDFAGYWAFGRGGPVAFADIGRVWTDGESSRSWHSGAGGGVWLQIFDAALIRATFGISEDDRTTTIGMGFQF